jgi:hypothetical protein
MTTQAMSWMRGRAGRYAGMVAGFSDWCGRSRVLMAAAAGMVLAAGVFACPAAASASTPGITLKPMSGPPTAKVSVTGAGFGTSETVTVDFNATQVATATTSSTGTFTAGFTVPKSAQPGTYPVTATGQSSGLSASQNFLVRTNWPMLRFAVSGTGYNPYENTVSTANVGNLALAWSEPSSQVTHEPNSPPAEVNGVLYTGSALGEVDAYSPTTGALLWRGASIGTSGSAHTPAVVNGWVYVASSDSHFYAYAAKVSSAHCSGSAPATCNPIWTASIADAGSNNQSSAVVSGGVVYVAAGSTLYAFDANGCGAPTCNPIWVSAGSTVDGSSTPAISGGVVYVAGSGGLDAYSTDAGSANCSGIAPATCTPLWTGNVTSVSTTDTSPAIANGVVYLSISPGHGTLYAFDANGCGAATCSPKWSRTNSIAFTNYATPAVANGKIYVNSSNAVLYVFSPSGSLLWSAPAPGSASGAASAAVVANGVVYAGYSTNIEAFSASGDLNCTGGVCTPLWTQASPSSGGWDTPEVVNGMLFAKQFSGQPLSAYKLPMP